MSGAAAGIGSWHGEQRTYLIPGLFGKRGAPGIEGDTTGQEGGGEGGSLEVNWCFHGKKEGQPTWEKTGRKAMVGGWRRR